MRGRLWLWALIGSLLLVGCQQSQQSQQSQSQPNLDARRQALLAADSAFQAAAEEGENVDSIVSFWTDDAVVYPPGQPAVRGKKAIRKYVAGALQIEGFEISWETLDATLGPSGEMGYLTHRNEVTAPDSAGNLVTTPGKGVTIWRRTSDGQWKCVVDIWNASPSS